MERTLELVINNMGCCTSIRVGLVNEVFSQLPIRNVSIKSFISNFNLQSIVTPSKFQLVINDYLLLKGGMYSSYNAVLFDYWFDFYNNLSYDMKSIQLGFIIGLLCRNFFEEDGAVLAQALTASESKDKDKAKEMFYPRAKFKNVIKAYIQLLTVDTVDYFKSLSSKPEEYRSELEAEWEVKAIDAFADELFNISNKKDESVNQCINVKEFLKEHLATLRNDQLLRKEFGRFSREYRRKNMKRLELSQLKKDNRNVY